jgi:hypothetical protein
MDQRELHQRDARRDIGKELLEAIRDVKAGCYGRVHAISLRTAGSTPASAVVEARPLVDGREA